MSNALFTVLMLVVPLYVVIGMCIVSAFIPINNHFNWFVFLLWPLFVAVKFIKILIKKLLKDFIEAVSILFQGVNDEDISR